MKAPHPFGGLKLAHFKAIKRHFSPDISDTEQFPEVFFGGEGMSGNPVTQDFAGQDAEFDSRSAKLRISTETVHRKNEEAHKAFCFRNSRAGRNLRTSVNCVGHSQRGMLDIGT
jgi:hypothetical protein